MHNVPFNIPFIAGKELHYIAQAVTFGNLGGDGHFTRNCAIRLEQAFGLHKVLMTPSCTASLEMAAQLCDIGPGDEVILPSYTFVSTASAFVRMGAKPVFVDIRPDTLNIDETKISDAITCKTKAICVVHYAGVACEMDQIEQVARERKIRLVEDAAQAVNSWYRGRACGGIGDLATFSFHETKNFICGEGGALCLNDSALVERAEIIRDKGTNRQRFYRGEVDKYTWVEIGSSYVPSELCCAFLLAQLEEMEKISNARREAYVYYEKELRQLECSGRLRLPYIPSHCMSNYHLFYVILRSEAHRTRVLEEFRRAAIGAVFHYVPLHSSPKGRELCGEQSLPVTEDMSSRLIRLPLYYSITKAEQDLVVGILRQNS